MSDGNGFFKAGGTMRPDAPSYLVRQADADLLHALLSREYVFLLDSRQKGKSSLIARTIVKLHENGVATVKLDLQRIGSNLTPEQWYGGLLAAIGQELLLTESLFAYWGANMLVGPLARWVGAVEEVVLPTIQSPLVIFVDEVDFVRALPFATDEFFAAIRDCFNRRSESNGFERLTFCLVGVATPGQLIRNPEITPFNIGSRIDISDFSERETVSFAKELGSDDRDGTKLMQRVHYWINGHPYLTQLLCSHISKDHGIRTPHDVDLLVKRLFLTPEARQREPNLSDVERRLLDPDLPDLTKDEQRTQVLELYGRVLKGRKVDPAEENPVVATLRLSGVGLEDRQTLRLRNRLYSVVFGEQWRRQSLPDAELRRQRGAARVALLRTAAVAGVLIMGVTTIALNTNRLANDRKRALVDLGQRTKELSQTAAEREAAMNDLGRKTNELEKLSSEQRQSLGTISDLNKNLSKEASSRLQTIEALNNKTAELERKSYDTTFYLIQDAIAKSQSDRAGKLAMTIENSPYKGWEWDYLTASWSVPPVVAELGVRTFLEKDEQGNIQLASSTGLYDVKGHNVSLVRKFDQTLASETRKKFQPYTSNCWAYPSGKPGRYRLWRPAYRDVDVILDAETDRILVNRTANRQIFDVDPVRHQYLSQPEKKATIADLEVRSLPDDTLIRTVKFHPPVNSVACYTAETYMTQRTVDGSKTEIKILDSNFTPIRKPYLLDRVIDGIDYSKDKSHLFIFQAEHFEIRRASDFSLLYQADEPETIMSLDFSKDLKEIVYATGNGTIRRGDLATGKVVADYIGSDQRVMYVAYADQGREVLSVDAYGRIRFWPKRENLAPKQVAESGLTTQTACFRRAERLIWTDLKAIFSWDAQTGAKKIRKMDQLAMVAGTDGLFPQSDDPQYVVAGTKDGVLHVMDPSTLETIRTVKVFAENCRTFVGQLSDPRLVIAMNASTNIAKGETAPIAVVDVETGQIKTRFEVPGSPFPVFSLRLMDSCIAFTPFNGKEIFIINVNTGKVMRRWAVPAITYEFACSHDGQILVVRFGGPGTGAKSTICLYSTVDYHLVKRLQSSDMPYGIVFSPDDRYMAASGSGGTGQVWDLKRNYKNFYFDGADVRRVAYSPDGARILTVGIRSNALTLWDAQNGSELMKIPTESSYNSDANRYVLSSIKFIQNGRGIALEGGDTSLRVLQLPKDASHKSKPRK